jgi:hypothetical protein
VKYIARIKVPANDRPRRVDCSGEGALPGACARAWNVERGDGAVRGAHEAMPDAA